jgi:plastocyanin
MVPKSGKLDLRVRDALLRSAPHHEVGKGLRLAASFVFLLAATPFARAEDVKVSIDNFTFNPQQLTVRAGTKVTFANHDDISHTVVSLQNFKSKVLDTEQEFGFTFTTPGTPSICAPCIRT